MPSTLLPIHPNARKRAAAHPGVLLVWHDIVDDRKLVWFDTAVREFEAQLTRLERAGANPVPLDDLYRYLRDGRPAPPPGAVVLCFDDNTLGIHDYAFPRLKARRWPFVVSAHTAFVGVRTGKEHNTWGQLQQMETGGAATIVSQTHTHPEDLRLLSDRDLRREMLTAKITMEVALDHAVRFVTYPSGKWDRRVALAAAHAGYRLGLTEDRGAAEASPHLLGLRRYSTHRRFDEAVRAITASRRIT